VFYRFSELKEKIEAITDLAKLVNLELLDKQMKCFHVYAKLQDYVGKLMPDSVTEEDFKKNTDEFMEIAGNMTYWVQV